jgi:hypothetical protein
MRPASRSSTRARRRPTGATACWWPTTARRHARRLHWLEVSDETLERLRLLGGYDDDLAHDVNRAANRLRDMLLAIARRWSGFSAPGSTIRSHGRCWPAIRRLPRCGRREGVGSRRWPSATRP